MGFKFSLKKSSSDKDGKTGGTSPQVPRTPLSQANPDWSEKTASLWAEHSHFLERTKVTGIVPPVRGGTITGLIAAEKKRSEASRQMATIGMLLVIPLTAGGVFFFLNVESGTVETPSIAEPVIPKNPNKNKGAGVTVPAAETIATAPSTAQTTTGPALFHESDVVTIKEIPFSIGATDSNYKAPNEKSLKPLIELSKTSPAEGDLPEVPRPTSSIDLAREEISNITKWVAKDPSARAIAEAWKTEARARVGLGVRPVVQFRWSTPEERKASEIARQELMAMHAMLMDVYAWGEQDVADQLHHSIVAYATTYKPIGDVYSDAELAPLIKAYANVWRRFTPDELKLTDGWLKLMADRQVTEAIQRQKRDDRWFAYHLHAVSLIGFATGNAQFQNYVRRNFSTHLATALRADGSVTLDQTGSMTLHTDHLSKLLETTVILYRVGRVVPETVPLATNTYGKAVAFTVPFALGYAPWNDFEKAKDPTIARRQSLGDIAVSVKPYIWRMDTSFLEALSFFRIQPNLREIAQAVGTPDARFPTPDSLFYDSMNRNVAWISPPVQGPRPASVAPSLPPKAK